MRRKNNKSIRRSPAYRFSNAKSQAKSKNVKWDLSRENFYSLIKDPCYYCNEMVITTGSGLDRIDPLKGYEINNVISCCFSCNITRNRHLTVKENKIFIEAIYADRRRKKNPQH